MNIPSWSSLKYKSQTKKIRKRVSKMDIYHKQSCLVSQTKTLEWKTMYLTFFEFLIKTTKLEEFKSQIPHWNTQKKMKCENFIYFHTHTHNQSMKITDLRERVILSKINSSE